MTADTHGPGSQLQDGIYLDPQTPPPPAWRALFIDIEPTASAIAAHDAIVQITEMLENLKRGLVRELAPALIPTNTINVLVGYGASFFDATRHRPILTTRARPAHLVALRRDGPAFPTVSWTDETANRGGEADLIFQFTGTTAHAVNRAAVEVAHLVADEQLPVRIAGTFDGFLRDDGRSWIGFHDGISNIEPSQRVTAVEAVGEPMWNEGGTYLAFLRLQIEMAAWWRLTREEQELIVGRDKLGGEPLTPESIRRQPPRPVITQIAAKGFEDSDTNSYIDPPDAHDGVLAASHIHRANQNRAAGDTQAAHRIFRQGYEYLDDIASDGPRLGLNFVSFQRDLYHLRQILGLKGWFGDANFGGSARREAATEHRIVSTMRAGGLYAVPPRATPYPGAALFEH